jgi:prepilin-type N-terminal cleavage/methylation domain-containing protein
MNMLDRLVRDQRGFSLAELLLVVAVLGLMLTGIALVQMQGQTSYLIGSHRVEAQQNGRVALELMARELRSAQSVTAIPSSTDMTFVDENGNSIQYSLSGTTLNRTTGGVTSPLIGGVRAFTLTYLSAYNGVTSTSTPAVLPTRVRLVRLQLVTGTDHSVANYSEANQSATAETVVRLRNM